MLPSRLDAVHLPHGAEVLEPQIQQPLVAAGTQHANEGDAVRAQPRQPHALEQLDRLPPAAVLGVPAEHGRPRDYVHMPHRNSCKHPAGVGYAAASGVHGDERASDHGVGVQTHRDRVGVELTALSEHGRGAAPAQQAPKSDLVGRGPAVPHSREKPECRLDVPFLGVPGDDGAPGDHVPGAHLLEHSGRLLEPPCAGVEGDDGVGDRSRARQTGTHRSRVELLPEAEFRQPSARRERRRVGVLIGENALRLHHRHKRSEGVFAAALLEVGGNDGGPGDDVGRAHLPEENQPPVHAATLPVHGRECVGYEGGGIETGLRRLSVDLPAAGKKAVVSAGLEDDGQRVGVARNAGDPHLGEAAEGLLAPAGMDERSDHGGPGDDVPLGHFIEELEGKGEEAHLPVHIYEGAADEDGGDRHASLLRVGMEGCPVGAQPCQPAGLQNEAEEERVDGDERVYAHEGEEAEGFHGVAGDDVPRD